MPNGEMIVDVLPDTLTFPQAFSEAQRRNLQFFTWKGKEFNTKNAAPVTAPPAQERQAPDTTAAPIQPLVETPGLQQQLDTGFPNVQAGDQAAPSPFYAPGQGPTMTPPVAAPPQAQPMMGTGGPTPPVNMNVPPAGVPPATPSGPPPMSGSGMPIATGTGGQLQSPSVGDSMGRLIPAELQKGPAATPAEAEARVGTWQKIVERVKSDPNLLMALVSFGTRLMQPVPPGQTAAGHFGTAVQGGLDYLGTLQNQQSTRAVQGAEVNRLGAGTAQTEAQTSNLLPAQVQNVGANTSLQRAQVPHLEAQTKLTQAEAQLRQLDANSKPELVQATIQKLKAEGILDQARADELSQRLKDNPDYQAAAIDLLKAQAEHARQAGKAVNEHFQRYQDLKAAFRARGDDEATASLNANQMMFAGGAQRSTNIEDADAQVQVLQSLYQASQSDPKNKRKGQTFQQFVADDLAYGSSAGLPPATKALVLSRVAKGGATTNAAGQPAAVPGATGAQSSPQASPLPSSQDQLRDGVVYDTARGPAVWDAKHKVFVPR